jgi:hypothetical protein
MAKLPGVEQRCQQFCEEHGRKGTFDYYECHPPYTHLVFWVKRPGNTGYAFNVLVAEWQAWNDKHGWGDM